MEITPCCEEQIPKILELWKNQYQAELSDRGPRPNTWILRSSEIKAFLRKQSGSAHFAVATRGGEVLGYMFFQVFPFHGEATAFCPIMGHAEKGARREVLEYLYQNLSEELVAKGVLSHVITYFAHDKAFEDAVFALGFGLMVIDAFRDTKPIQAITNPAGVQFLKATQDNICDLKALADESLEYYIRAPIFLNRRSEPKEYYQGLLNSSDKAVYLAFVEEEPVGVMSVRRNKELRFVDLCDIKTALIDEVGAYIKPAYRGRDIGTTLLSMCFEWCRLNEINMVHVDFESANLRARSFWLKFFTETMKSVRRTVYSDVLSTQHRDSKKNGETKKS
jgi:GNAT superfamily N-acetyltransferase